MNCGKSTRASFLVLQLRDGTGCPSLWYSGKAHKRWIHNGIDCVGYFGMRGNFFTSIVVATIS